MLIRDETNLGFIVFAGECCDTRLATGFVVQRTLPIPLAACLLVIGSESVAVEEDVTRASFGKDETEVIEWI